MTKKEITPVAPQETALTAQILSVYADDTGFENVDSQSNAIPRISLLQALSPQVSTTNPKYIRGALAGDFYNETLGEVIPGETGLNVIPIFFKREYVEWIPRENGGGFVALHGVDDAIVQTARKDEVSGKLVTQSGNELQDTRSHLVLVLRDDGTHYPAVIDFYRTQVAKSKSWVTRMQMKFFIGEDKKQHVQPMYASKYHLTSTAESNKKSQTWSAFKIEDLGPVTPDQLADAAAMRSLATNSKLKVVNPGAFVEEDDTPEAAQF